MLKILLLMVVLSIPSYAQSDLSPAAKLLLEEAKNEKSTKSSVNNNLGYYFAVTTKFDGGVTFPLYGMETDFGLFNVTSLEFYIPLERSTHFLTTFRFSTPVSDDYHNEFIGLYKMRLGFGLGMSGTMSDKRNSQGLGMVTTLNMLLVADFMFLNEDVYNTETYSSLGSHVVYRLDTGMRYNYFIHKNIAVVVGFDMGLGLATGYVKQSLGSDGYPVEPLEAYGSYARGIYTFGVTAGIRF